MDMKMYTYKYSVDLSAYHSELRTGVILADNEMDAERKAITIHFEAAKRHTPNKMFRRGDVDIYGLHQIEITEEQLQELKFQFERCEFNQREKEKK